MRTALLIVALLASVTTAQSRAYLRASLLGKPFPDLTRHAKVTASRDIPDGRLKLILFTSLE